MDKSQYDAAVESAVANAVERLGHTPSPALAETVLTDLATQAARLSRDYHLLNLTTAADIAERLGVSMRAVQAKAARRHAEFGIGAQIGGMWVFAADEVESMLADLREK